jgi:hypothetical protein
MKPIATSLTTLLLILGTSAYAFNPVAVRCGKITNFKLADDVVWSWEQDDYGPEPLVQAGEEFAIVTVSLDDKMSVGKYDYLLGGEPCLAMSVAQAPFDPSNWEQKFQGAGIDVNLAFKVKDTPNDPYPLTFELTTREPILRLTEAGALNEFGQPLGTTVDLQAAAAASAAALADPAGDAAAPAGDAPAPAGDAAAPADSAPDAAAAAAADAAAAAADPAAAPGEAAKPEPVNKEEPKPAAKPPAKPAKGDDLLDW